MVTLIRLVEKLPACGRGLEWDDLEGPIQLKPLSGFMILTFESPPVVCIPLRA